MVKKIDKEFFKEIDEFIREFYQKNSFVRLLKLQIVNIEEGEFTLAIDVEDIHTNFYGIAHGGALMSIADTAMGGACLSCNKKVVTLSCTMNFIKAAPLESRIIAAGKVIHNGSRTMACEVEIKNEKGELLGKASGSFFVIGEFKQNEMIEK